MEMEFLFTAALLTVLFILIYVVYRMGPSDKTRIKRFKKKIKEEYHVNAKYVKKKKLLGDNYYVFKTKRRYFTVSETGIISNVKL